MSLYENLLERMNGREYSGYFVALCPFPHHGHNEEHPSFFVYEDGYRCASCRRWGSLQSLSRILGDYFFVHCNAVSNILPQWRRWGNSLDEIVEKAHATLKKFPQFQGYLKKRKYERFLDLGYFGYRDGWSVIPVFDMSRKVVDVVVRAVKGKGDTRYVVKPGALNRPLYSPNWQRVKDSPSIYVVFGIFDSWAMESIEQACVTGITGKSVPVELLASLNKRGIIVPDLGEEDDAHQLANQLGWKYRVKKLVFPDGTKDPSGIHEMYGDECLKNLIGV